MKLTPFLYAVLRIPVRTVLGTMRIGIGVFIRLGTMGWIIVMGTALVAVVVLVLAKALSWHY